MLTFIESINDVRYTSKVPKRIFLQKYKNDTSLDKFKVLHKQISRSSIHNYAKSKSLLEALYIESVNYNSLDEFRKKILSYRSSIDKKSLSRYFVYLERLMPIYEKLIWNKNYKKTT